MESGRGSAGFPHRLVDGVVYISSDGSRSCRTGELQWSFQLDGDIISSPTVAEGNVYFSAEDGLYVLDARTGDLVWRPETDDVSYAPPAVDKGIVYFASHNTVFAFDAGTGNLH